MSGKSLCAGTTKMGPSPCFSMAIMIAHSYAGNSMAVPDANRAINRAVAVSVFIHALFFLCFSGTVELFGKAGRGVDGPETGVRRVLAASLVAVAEASPEDGEKTADAEVPDGAPAGWWEHKAADAPSLPGMVESPPEVVASSDTQVSNPSPELAAELPRRTSGTEAADDAYSHGAHLTVPPVMLTKAAVSDAVAALAEWVEPGRYVLQLSIDQEGKVVEVLGSLSPDGKDGLVHEQLLAAFASVRFSPARINGLAVNGHTTIEISAIDDSPRSSRVSDKSFP